MNTFDLIGCWDYGVFFGFFVAFVVLVFFFVFSFFFVLFCFIFFLRHLIEKHLITHK